MEFTHSEQLELDNSREHLKVVQGNLRIASGELSGVLSQLKEAREKLADVIKFRESLIGANLQLLKEQDERSVAQDRRETTILNRENKQLEVDKLFQQKTLESINELEDINRKMVIAKSQHGKLIESQDEEIKSLEEKIITLKEKVTNYEETIREQSGVKKEQENEVLRLGSEIEEAQKRLDKFMSDSNKVMAITARLIDEEKAKIKNPLELIKREQEKLETLRNDLAIIKVRLTQQFERQNPEKGLPLELQ